MIDRAADGTVLVTGGTGAIGTALAAALRGRGAAVTALGRGDGDLLQAGTAARLIEAHRPAALVHLAWDVRGEGYADDPVNDAWLRASLELLTAFEAAGGGRALVAGTCAEYAPAAFAGGPVTEDAPLIGPDGDGGSRYARAKRELFERARALEGIDLLWPRIFYVFSRRDEPPRLLGDLRRAARAGERLVVHSGGLERDYLPAAAAGAALAELLATGASGPVNLGSGQALRVGELAAAVAAALGLDPGNIDDRGLVPAGAAPRIVADTSRLESICAWRPPESPAAAVALELGPGHEVKP